MNKKTILEELAIKAGGRVAIYHTKSCSRKVIEFSPDALVRFEAGVKSAELKQKLDEMHDKAPAVLADINKPVSNYLFNSGDSLEGFANDGRRYGLKDAKPYYEVEAGDTKRLIELLHKEMPAETTLQIDHNKNGDLSLRIFMKGSPIFTPPIDGINKCFQAVKPLNEVKFD